MKIEVTVTSQVIANLMTSAMESGDPVTTGARGGWCDRINLIFIEVTWSSSQPIADYVGKPSWYSEPEVYDNSFLIEVVEIVDENNGTKVTHQVTRDKMRKGLTIMANQFPSVFAQIFEEDIDTACADLFLQLILFGEEKYG